MKNIKHFIILTSLLLLNTQVASAAIIFSFSGPPNNANVCDVTSYTIALSDVPLQQFPLTITLNTMVMQGNLVLSLPPYPTCGVGLPSSGVSPSQIVNEQISGSTCPSVSISSTTVNQGTYIWVISAVGCSGGSINFNLKYDIILDCALIPQNFQTNQSLTLDQTCTVGGTSQNLLTSIPLPHILNAPPITVAGNYGQITDMIFEYQNNGSAPIDIFFSFDDLYQLNCLNPAYSLEGMNPVKYTIGASSPAPPPGVYSQTLAGGMSNFITIPANQSLYIKQHIKLTECHTNCPSERKVEFKWQCANNYQNYQACVNCQKEYVTQFTFATELPSFTVERIYPDLQTAEYNTRCFGDTTHWRVRVTNTSQNTTFPNIKINLKSGSYGPAGLVTIYENSIVQTPQGTNCTNCTLTPASVGVLNTSSACYSSSGGLNLGNAYGEYNVSINNLAAQETVTFMFVTYNCCNSDPALLGTNKMFNHWIANSTATTKCNTNVFPAAIANGLALSSAGNISSHSSTSDDIDLTIGFTPSYPSDFTVNTPSYFYMYPSPSTTNQVMSLGGLFGDNFDKQVFGYTSTNQNVTGILRAQINCSKGLVVCAPSNISLEYTPSGGSVTPVTLLGYYTPNNTVGTTGNPDNCPSCIASHYNFYYDLSAIADIDDFFNSAKFNFNLTPCCNADPVTDYDVTWSVLPNASCFNITLPTAGTDLTCNDAITPGNGCCWLPLSKDGWHVNVHCPGCRAPGIIVDDYRMKRNSFGFPDATNDRIADNTTAITPQTLNAYEASIAPNKLSRHASVYGDKLIDRLSAHFEPGDPSNIDPAGSCTDFYRGYTYTGIAADCWPPINNVSDMSSKGINLDVLQLHRIIDYSNASTQGFNLTIDNAILYIDEGCYNCIQCTNCDEFDYINSQLPNGQDDWSTKIVMTIPGATLNNPTFPFLKRDGDEYLFTFHERDIKNPPAGSNIIIQNLNGGNSGTFNYVENQQYRLIVNYTICGNRQSTNLYYPANLDLVFRADIKNKMWITGGSLGGQYPNGYDLSNTAPFDESNHDQMPNIVYDVNDPGNLGIPLNPDMESETPTQWAIFPFSTSPLPDHQTYCVGCVPIDQTFADEYKFYCETCGGSHTFFSTDIITSAVYAPASANPAINCDKTITITAGNSFGRSKFTTASNSGNFPRDLFPYEFKTPALFPNTWTLDIPSGYSLSTNTAPSKQSGYYSTSNNWQSVSNNVSQPLPFSPLLSLAGGQVIINPSDLGTLSCITGITPPIPNNLPNLVIGDNRSSQSINLHFTPNCNVGTALQYFQSGTPPNGLLPKAWINFMNNGSGCSTLPSGLCSFTMDMYNMNGPNVWAHPNPNLDVDFSPSNTDAFTSEVCWPFTITNFPAPPPLPTDPAYTDAINVFISVPTGTQFNYLTGWNAQYTYNGSQYNSSANPGGIIGLLPNGSGAPVSFPINQNSVISGKVCATYNPCQINASFNFKTGWDCDGIPANLLATCNQDLTSSPVTITDLPVKLQPDYSSLVWPSSGVYLCSGNNLLEVKFENVDFGKTLATGINITGQNFTVNSVEIFSCIGPGSSILGGSGNSYTIAQTDLDLIGYAIPNNMIGLNNCIGVRVYFTADCPATVAPIALPGIELVTTSYCGQPISSEANFLPVPVLGTNCNNCYVIGKTCSPNPVAVGETVTFEIKVCNYSMGTSPSMNVDDSPPPLTNFIASPVVNFPVSTGPINSMSCFIQLVTGIFTNMGTCPDIDFTNTATLMSTGQQVSVCVDVTCPSPDLANYSISTDADAFTAFNGLNNLSSQTIAIADNVVLTIDAQTPNFNFNNCTLIMGSGSQIIINPNCTLGLHNNTVIYSCPQMWRGISVGIGSQIVMRNSTIRDAEYAINLDDHTDYEIRDSYILNCVTGLYTDPSLSPLFNITGTVTGTQFAKTALLLKGEYPGQPLHGNVGRAGIWFNNVAYIAIGDNGSTENEFNDINFGIETHNSNVDVLNCRFHDIVADATYGNWLINPAPKPWGCGVHARGIDEASSINVLPLTSGSTTIENAPVGVYTNFINARVMGVRMFNVIKGVNSELSVARTVSVTGCNIHARFRGIDFNENHNAFNMVASENIIYLEPTTGTGKGQACIYMRESQLGNDANYNISNNLHLETLSGMAGIATLNVDNAYISYNHIFTNTGTLLPAPGSIGIAISGGARNTANCNIVTNTIPFSNLGTIGMQVSTSQSNSIGCNYFNGSYTGMRYYAQCGGTNMYGNSMLNNFKGLQLNSNAEIGQQIQRGNIFTGNYSASPLGDFGADNLNNTGQGLLSSRLTVHQGMGTVNGTNSFYFPKIPLYDFGNLTFVPLYGQFGTSGGVDDWFVNLPGTPFSCANSTVCLAWAQGEGDTYERMIATGNTQTVDYKPESKAMSKQYLFENLFLNDSLLQSDSIYLDFYADIEPTDIGQLNEVKATLKEARYDDNFMQLILQTSNLIASKLDSIRLLDSLSTTDSTLIFIQQRGALLNTIGLMQQALNNMKAQQQAVINSKLNDALQVNQIVIPNEVPQSNQKIMNGISANARLQGESYVLSQIPTALGIAHQCPYSGGPAVYQARAFIEKYYSETEDYDDVNTCLQQGIYKQSEQPINEIISTHDFAVYPNPAQNKINIEIKNKIIGICKLEVLSTTGVNVWTTEYNCEEKKHEADISNLTNGMYYVRIIFNNEYRFISKLAIIR
jgi:hypothetical protein